MTSPRLLVRAARAVVTPVSPEVLGGYAAPDRVAAGTHLDLEAQVLAVSSSAGRFCWVGLDAVAISAEMQHRVARAVSAALDFSPEEIVVVASHTHSAPRSWSGTIHPVLPGGIDLAACDAVAEQAATAIALASWQRAELQVGDGSVVGVGANRHRPDGPWDASSRALLFRSPSSSRPLALVAWYGCHPTVLGAENRLYSPDWVGGMREVIRRSYGGALPTIYLPGAAGDVSTRFTRQSREPAEAMRLGAVVGHAVLDSLAAAAPAADPEVTFRRDRFAAVTRTGFEDLAPSGMHSPSAEAAPSRIHASFAEARAAQEAFETAEVPDRVVVPMSLAQVGSTRWLHAPFELSAALALEAGFAADRLRLVGYADAYLGYLVDDRSAAEGHYEAASSFFDLAETKRILAGLGAFAELSVSTPDASGRPSR